MDESELEKLSIEYLKSYLSINSYIGCTINCAYCFLAPIKIVPMKPIKVIDEKKLVENTVTSKYFKKDITVLSLNNRTDPFITSEVAESTYKILEELNNKGLKNIITVTTKGLITEEMANKLSKLNNIRLVIIVTFNGINQRIQPISPEVQKDTMKNIARYKNIKLLQQCRPIIKGINDSYETLKDIVEFASKYCDATIYQGVRVNDVIKERLKERQYNYTGKKDKHKVKDIEVDEIFKRIQKEHNGKYYIFDHTSCCLSYIFGEKDYNMHYKKRICSNECPNYKMCMTKSNSKIKNENIKKELEKIGVKEEYELHEEELFIKGSLNDEQRSYIRHVLRLSAKSEKRESTYSERIMEGEK